jgi:hypothetical protein
MSAFDDLLLRLGLKPSSHVYSVAGVLVVFLLIHVIVLAVILHRMRFRRGALTLVTRNVRKVVSTDQAARHFPWIVWVTGRFFGPRRPDPNADRDTAINELDVRLAADGWLLFLQKLLHFGPLLGVLLTTFGLITLELPNSDNINTAQLIPLMLRSILPLTLSMGAGVLIAICNLLCQHSAELSVDKLRNSSREWLDNVVLKEVFASQTQNAWADPVHQVAVTLSDVKQQFDHMAVSLGNASSNITSVIAEFGSSLSSVMSRLDQLPERFDMMTQSADHLAKATEGLVGRGQDQLGRLGDLVSKIDTVITDRLDRCTSSMSRTANQLETTATHLNEQALGLGESADAISKGSHAQVSAFDELQSVIAEKLLPTHKDLHATVEGLRLVMTNLSEPLDSLKATVVDSAKSVSRVVHAFDSLHLDFGSAIGEFNHTVSDSLTPACLQQASLLKAQVHTLEQFQAGLDQLQVGVQTLAGFASGLDEHQSTVSRGLQTLKTTLDQTDRTCLELHSFLDQRWHPLVETMAGSMDTVRNSSRNIETAITGSLGPSMQSLGNLSTAVQSFEKTLQPLLDLADTQRLIDTLDNVKWTPFFGPRGDLA